MTQRDHEDQNPLDRPQSAPITAPITESEVYLLMMHLLRFPVLMSEAIDEVKPDCFDGVREAVYFQLWRAAAQLHTQIQRCTYELLVSTVSQMLADNPESLFDQERTELLHPGKGGILFDMLHVDEKELDVRIGRILLHRFLHERKIVIPLRKLLHSGDAVGSFPQDMLPALESVRQVTARIATNSELSAHAAIPDASYDEVPDILIPTGIQFIDNLIGGQRPGDANGILGPFGAGKSTLGFQLGVENARAAVQDVAATGGVPGVTFVLSYEEPRKKYQKRAWSCACQISRARLESFRNVETSLTSIRKGDLKPYEQSLERDPITHTLLGERERWEAALLWLNKALVLCDMSGSGEHPTAGTGYVPEIARMMERVLAKLGGPPVRAVIIDYVGLAAKRYMQARNIPEERLRHFIGGFGDAARREISERFQCTTWCLHQFNGEANKTSALRALHHADSAEAKNFAENLAVCLCLGNIDRRSLCVRINPSKLRYGTPPEELPILRHDPDIARLIDVSHEYRLDTLSRSFVNVEGFRHALGNDRGRCTRRRRRRLIDAARHDFP